MLPKLSLFVFNSVVGIALTSAPAAAQVYVDSRLTQNSAWSNFQTYPSIINDADLITIDAPANGVTRQYRMWTLNPNQSLPAVFIRVPTATAATQVIDFQVGLPMGSPPTSSSGSPISNPDVTITRTGSNWGGFVTNGDQVSLQAAINGGLTNSVYRVEFNQTPNYTKAVRVHRLSMLGDLAANKFIIGTPVANYNYIGGIEANSTFVNSLIVVRDGKLNRLLLTGNMLGDFDAAGSPGNQYQGSLGTLTVNGDIGTLSAPVSIYTYRGIDRITAANISANIITGAYNTVGNPLGEIGEVTTNGSPGDFSGSLIGDIFVGSRMTIKGSLRGEIDIYRDTASGQRVGGLDFTQSIWIGNSLATDPCINTKLTS